MPMQPAGAASQLTAENEAPAGAKQKHKIASRARRVRKVSTKAYADAAQSRNVPQTCGVGWKVDPFLYSKVFDTSRKVKCACRWGLLCKVSWGQCCCL